MWAHPADPVPVRPSHSDHETYGIGFACGRTTMGTVAGAPVLPQAGHRMKPLAPEKEGRAVRYMNVHAGIVVVGLSGVEA